jgi:hypothetical protein
VYRLEAKGYNYKMYLYTHQPYSDVKPSWYGTMLPEHYSVCVVSCNVEGHVMMTRRARTAGNTVVLGASALTWI